MTPTTGQKGFEFPCKFPIKIMADPDKKIVEFVLSTLEAHIDDPEKIDFHTKESKNGNYISITATFTATSKEQLDTLYKTLSDHKQIHMVL